MKRLLHIIALAAALIVSLMFVAILVLIPPRKYFGNLPRASTIQKVEVGMTKQQVIDLLGAPSEIEPSTFTYSRAALTRYPHLWVHFRDGAVYNVYAKEYPHLGDDNAVYSYSGKGNDTNVVLPQFFTTF